MRAVHPKYEVVTVKCACGAEFQTRSTRGGDDYTLEICSECHPFYTGTQKIVDSEGRVDRFRKKLAIAQQAQQAGGKKKKKKATTQVKAPPKVGKVVPIEVKPKERRGRGGPGRGGPGRGGPGGGRGPRSAASDTKSDAPKKTDAPKADAPKAEGDAKPDGGSEG